MGASGLVFRRIGGRIVPIGAKGQLAGKLGARAAGSTANQRVAKHNAAQHSEKIHPNHFLGAGSTVAAVASGLIAGATLHSVLKTFAIGHATSLGLDVGGAAMAGAAYAGRGNTKQRIKMAATHEGVNQAIGWGVFGAMALRDPRTRAKIIEYGAKAAGVAKTFAMKVAL